MRRKKRFRKKKYFHVEISIPLGIDLANRKKSVIYTLSSNFSCPSLQIFVYLVSVLLGVDVACGMNRENCDIEAHIHVSSTRKVQLLDFPSCHLYLIFFHFQSTTRIAIINVFFPFCRKTRGGCTKVSSNLDA